MGIVLSLEEQQSELRRLENLLKECLSRYDACLAEEDVMLKTGNRHDADYAHRESVRVGREIRELRSRIDRLKEKAD